MALAYRAGNTSLGANSGNLVMGGLPAGHTLNDILFLVTIHCDNVASTVSGYTLIHSITNGAAMIARVFAKRDGGSETAPTITHTAGSTITAFMFAISGVDAGLTVGTGAGAIVRDVQSATGSVGLGATFTATTPTVTTSTGDILNYIGAHCTSDTSGAVVNNWSTVSTFTERVDGGRVGTVSDSAICAHDTLTSAGSGAARSSTGNASGFAGTQNWAAILMVVNQDAAGGVTTPPLPFVVDSAVDRAASF